MSNYLNIYVQDKSTKEKRLLVNYCSSCPIYQAFKDNMDVAYGREKESYTELTSYNMICLLDTLVRDKRKTEDRIMELEKHAGGNADLINEILSWKDALKEDTSTLEAVRFIADIVNDSTNGFNDFDGVFININ